MRVVFAAIPAHGHVYPTRLSQEIAAQPSPGPVLPQLEQRARR